MLKNAEKLDVAQQFQAFFVSFAELNVGKWAFFLPIADNLWGNRWISTLIKY